MKASRRAQAKFRRMSNSYIKPAKSGLTFDGIFVEPVLNGLGVWGDIFRSDLQKEGWAYQTEMVVDAGEILSSGKYIETEDGKRFIVIGAPKERWDTLHEWIRINEKTLSSLRWS